MDLMRKTHIEAQVEALLFDKAPISILIAYFNNSNVFLAKKVVKHLEHIVINDYVVKL